MNNRLVIISGPTASGKTSWSMKLAEISRDQLGLSPVIVNFDSLCFYQELEIGTAKPSLEERGDIPHELFDICSVKDDFNASKFVNLAEEKVTELQKKDKLVFLVGGSAFYLRALIKGMYESTEIPEDLKNQTMEQYEKEGIDFVINYLEQNDPDSLTTLHSNDHYRLIRAYYHHRTTGEKFSDEKTKMDKKEPYNLLKDAKNKWELHHIYLNVPKEEHYEIIKARTSKMLEDGLIKEIKNLMDQGYKGSEKALQSIGYKEVISHLNDNGLENLNQEQLIEEIFISTRQLAKSQRTFFKKITPKNEYHPLKDGDSIKQDFLNFLAKK